MMRTIYQRKIHELKEKASMWWPEGLQNKNSDDVSLGILLKTQDDFLRILMLCKNHPFQFVDLVRASGFQGNLFLKHLVVLTDFGGELIQRLGKSFGDIFPVDNSGSFYFDFFWEGKPYRYTFARLPIKGLGNVKLSIDGDRLGSSRELDDLLIDMSTLLLHGAASNFGHQSGLDLCMVGSMLGRDEELSTFVRQRYIHVSRILGGAKANRLGQFAQTDVVEFMKKNLGSSYEIHRNGRVELPGKGGMPFDIVVILGEMKFGIEISFQVTTNSTIERKAGQAAERQSLMHKEGYRIAYVIDGAGNFQRSTAITVICDHSDCTVAYSEEEFQHLCDWIRSETL